MVMNPNANSDAVVLARIAPFRLGTVQIDPANCLIRDQDGQEQIIEPRMMQVLVALARAKGAIVTRDDLIASCWAGRIVSNDAVSRVISHLRLLAGGIAAGSFQMETLPRIGYRLTVTDAGEPPSDMVPDTGPAPVSARRFSRRNAIVLTAGAAAVLAAGMRIGWRDAPSQDRLLLINPLTIEGRDHALDVIAQTMSDALRSDLARVPGLRLSAPTGRDASDRPSDPDYRLDGSVARMQDGLRLSLTLTDAGSDQQLWSGAIDAAMAGISDLQRDLSAALIEQLVLRLPVASTPPTSVAMRGDPEAYRLSEAARLLCDDVRDLFLAGQQDAAQVAADRVMALAQQSLALAPESPGGLIVMADLTRNGWSHGIAARKLTTQQRVDQALLLLRRALRSDPANAGAMVRIADLYRRFSWRWDDAATLFRHAIVNDPANADAHWAYSHLLATLGDVVAGLDHGLTLKQLTDTHLWHRITLPRLLLLAGYESAAMTLYYQELDNRPYSYFLLYEIYYLLVARGDRAGLQAYVDRLEKGGQTSAAIAWMIGRCRAALAAMAGQPEALLAILDAELARYDAGGLSLATIGGRARDDLTFILAIEYACAGQYDRAIALLGRALQAMSVYWLPTLPYGSAPFPPAMQRDPRFQALWQRDSRLADAVARRGRAAQAKQMSTALSDSSMSKALLPAPLLARLHAAFPGLPIS